MNKTEQLKMRIDGNIWIVSGLGMLGISYYFRETAKYELIHRGPEKAKQYDDLKIASACTSGALIFIGVVINMY